MPFQVTMAYPFSAGVNVSSNWRRRLDPILLEFQYRVIRNFSTHTERARPLLPLHLTFGDVKSSRIVLAQIEPFTTVLNHQLKTSRLVIERASFNW